MNPVSITPFEEQVLTTVAAALPASGSAKEFADVGRTCCGYAKDWAGGVRYRQGWCQDPLYPKINLALGRLARKGLVQRAENFYYTNWGYTSGLWQLTDQGKLFMGIDLT